MKFLRALRGLVSSADSSTDPSDDAAPSERSGSRRRRGRRGGRGRRRGGGAANQQHGGTTTPVAERTQNQTQTERSGRSERRSSGGGRRSTDRRRPWRRASLDAPLPEDVAFRPAAEGGDGSILPGRRRPPPGARTTNRVLVTGKRILPSFFTSGDDEPEHQETLEPTNEGATSAVEQAPADDEQAKPAAGKRRRRGRRGGRGRGGRSSNGSAPAEADRPQLAAEPQPESEPEPAPQPEIEIDSADFPDAFASLGLSDRTLAAVARMGFTTPTPVPGARHPVLMTGRDVVGIAQTGTGKTLAFGIPMMEARRPPPLRTPCRAIVLVPTRELAQQVLSRSSTDLVRSPSARSVIALLGGHAPSSATSARWSSGPQVVVGTPGRDEGPPRPRHTVAAKGEPTPSSTRPTRCSTSASCPTSRTSSAAHPRRRQTALFSATMPHTVDPPHRPPLHGANRRPIADRLRRSTTVETDRPGLLRGRTARQAEAACASSSTASFEDARSIFIAHQARRGLRLTDQLQGMGVRVGALHGDMDQRRRDRMSCSRFRDGELDVLIATNVAARGLDIPEITHVVNYDVAAERRGVRPPHRTHRPRGTRRQGHHLRLRARHGRPLRHPARGLRRPPARGAPRALRLAADDRAVSAHDRGRPPRVRARAPRRPRPTRRPPLRSQLRPDAHLLRLPRGRRRLQDQEARRLRLHQPARARRPASASATPRSSSTAASPPTSTSASSRSSEPARRPPSRVEADPAGGEVRGVGREDAPPPRRPHPRSACSRRGEVPDGLVERSSSSRLDRLPRGRRRRPQRPRLRRRARPSEHGGQREFGEAEGFIGEHLGPRRRRRHPRGFIERTDRGGAGALFNEPPRLRPRRRGPRRPPRRARLHPRRSASGPRRPGPRTSPSSTASSSPTGSTSVTSMSATTWPSSPWIFEALGRPDLGDEVIGRYMRRIAHDETLGILQPLHRTFRAFVRGKVESIGANAPEVPEADTRAALANSARALLRGSPPTSSQRRAATQH